MKKMVSLVLALLMLLGTATTLAEVTLTYNDWSSVDTAWSDCYADLLARFDELYGDEITVETYGTTAAETRQAMLLSASAGTNEDCAKTKPEWLEELVNMGVLADLNELLPQEVLDDYADGVLEDFTFDGKLNAISFFNQAYAIYYNKDLLEKAGVTELPTTYPELIEAAYKVAALGQDENGNKIYGIGYSNGANKAGDSNVWLTLLWGYGGEFQDEEGNITLYSEENLEAFNVIKNLLVDDVSPAGLSWQDLRQIFAAGNMGFFPELLSQTTLFTSVSELGEDFLDHIGVMEFPEGTGYNTQSLLVIFENSENKEAAAKFIEFLSSEEGLKILYEHNKGKTSDRLSVVESVYSDEAELDEFTQVFVDAAAHNRSLPMLADPAFAPADLAITDAIHRMYAGEDVETVLKELDAEVKGYYGQN